MRLSEWRADAPYRDSLGQKVLAVVEPILSALGAERDPHAWVAWGDDPAVRYPVLVPSPAGLIVCHVRVNVPGEGPRASAKLVRWSKVQLGELAVETQGGHRLVSFQVEGLILRGADDAADRVAAFGVDLMAAIDGRPMPNADPPRRHRSTAAGARKATTGATSRTTARTAPAKTTSTRRLSDGVPALPAPKNEA